MTSNVSIAASETYIVEISSSDVKVKEIDASTSFNASKISTYSLNVPRSDETVSISTISLPDPDFKPSYSSLNERYPGWFKASLKSSSSTQSLESLTRKSSFEIKNITLFPQNEIITETPIQRIYRSKSLSKSTSFTDSSLNEVISKMNSNQSLELKVTQKSSSEIRKIALFPKNEIRTFTEAPIQEAYSGKSVRKYDSFTDSELNKVISIMDMKRDFEVHEDSNQSAKVEICKNTKPTFKERLHKSSSEIRNIVLFPQNNVITDAPPIQLVYPSKSEKKSLPFTESRLNEVISKMDTIQDFKMDKHSNQSLEFKVLQVKISKNINSIFKDCECLERLSPIQSTIGTDSYDSRFDPTSNSVRSQDNLNPINTNKNKARKRILPMEVLRRAFGEPRSWICSPWMQKSKKSNKDKHATQSILGSMIAKVVNVINSKTDKAKRMGTKTSLNSKISSDWYELNRKPMIKFSGLNSKDNLENQIKDVQNKLKQLSQSPKRGRWYLHNVQKLHDQLRELRNQLQTVNTKLEEIEHDNGSLETEEMSLQGIVQPKNAITQSQSIPKNNFIVHEKPKQKVEIKRFLDKKIIKEMEQRSQIKVECVPKVLRTSNLVMKGQKQKYSLLTYDDFLTLWTRIASLSNQVQDAMNNVNILSSQVERGLIYHTDSKDFRKLRSHTT